MPPSNCGIQVNVGNRLLIRRMEVQALVNEQKQVEIEVLVTGPPREAGNPRLDTKGKHCYKGLFHSVHEGGRE